MDTYRHKGLRQRLVKALELKGIKDKSVLNAINSIPRHLFLDSAFEEQAYMDKALPIKSAQTISQPYTVVFKTELLQLKEDDIVLEIGTGSGYQAAILSLIVKKVYTIERHERLYQDTTKLLKKLGYLSVRTILGDGSNGLPRYAPFDKILVTAGADEVPEALLAQLKIGGCIVIPTGYTDAKEMLRITKLQDGKFETEAFGKFSFVPFLKGIKKIN